MRIPTATPLFIVALVATSSACSSADDAGTTSAQDSMVPEGTVVSCGDDPLVTTYAAGMQQTGKYGLFTFTLLHAEPAPPEMGTNSWTIAITDAGGAPVKDVVFPPLPEWGSWPCGVRPYMVHHGHSASVAPTMTENADGTYTISNIDFFMPGLWTVTIHAVSMSQADDGVFAFCIAG